MNTSRTIMAGLLLGASIGGALASQAIGIGIARAEARQDRKVASVISAEKFELVDKNGKIRAAIAHMVVDGTATTGLWLFDTKDEPRAFIALNDGGPVIGLCDADGKLRAELGAVKDATVLKLYDGKGTPSVVVGATTGGKAAIGLCDERGKRIWEAPK